MKWGETSSIRSDSYSAHFRNDSQRLVTTSYDGLVRLYSVEDKGLKLLEAKKSEGGKLPYSARFSPDGRMIAVGFDDTTVVQLLDATTLSEVARPSTEGVDKAISSQSPGLPMGLTFWPQEMERGRAKPGAAMARWELDALRGCPGLKRYDHGPRCSSRRARALWGARSGVGNPWRRRPGAVANSRRSGRFPGPG